MSHFENFTVRPQDLGIGRLFDGVRDAVIVAEAGTGRIVLWNPAATKTFGYSPSEAIGGLRVEDLVPEHLKARHQAGMARYRETGHGRYIDSDELLDLPAMHKTGEEIRIELSLTPIQPIDGSGADERFVLAIARDITGRRRTEEALLESEQRFRALVQNAMDLVVVQQADNTLSYVSPSVKRLLGYDPEEMVDAVGADYIHPEDLEWAWEKFYEMLETPGISEPIIIRYRHKDGSWRYFESICNNRMNDPAVGGLVFNCRDVTDRVRAEEEIRRLNEDLENRVSERTTQLEATVAELRGSQQTLRESEERFRLLVEGAKDYAIFMLDLEGCIASWNTGAERLLGYREEEILGRSFSTIYTPEDVRQGAPEQELSTAAEEGRAQDERWHVRKDGTRFWASGVVTPLLDEAGRLRGFAKVMRDSTERKQAEEALRISEARYRTLIEQSPLSIQILSPDGRTLRVNRAWEELWGVTLEDIEGYNLLADPQLVEKGIIPYIQRGFAGEPTTIPPILYDPEETISGITNHEEPKRWVRAFIYPVKDEAGNVREVVLIHEDVTERKRAEEALRESEERLRLATESAGLGTWDFDLTSSKLKCDDRTKALFGLSSEAEMDYETFLAGLHPEDRERVDRTVQDSLDPDKGGRYDIEYRTMGIEDGKQRWVKAAGRAFFDEDGRAARFIGTVLDITERKQAEEAMREMREAERRRIARDLHDGVLQDLSYTGAAMRLIKHKAEGTGLQEELQRVIDAVRRAAQGLRDAVNDLRLEEAQDRLLPELVESLVQRNRGMARGLEINLEVGEGFPSVSLGETGTELLRVIQEALTNARRHSGAKSVCVTLKTEGSELIAEILDDGRGFAPETASGVGLSSMRERAEAIGASLKIESEEGQGTRVQLRVPASRRE